MSDDASAIAGFWCCCAGRAFRIYREERLMVRRRGGRKRALGTRAPMLVPQLPNDRWSIDFVADQFIDGRRMCILIVVDAHGSAWRSSPTPRYQAFGSLASSISYWPIAASRR